MHSAKEYQVTNDWKLKGFKINLVILGMRWNTGGLLSEREAFNTDHGDTGQSKKEIRVGKIGWNSVSTLCCLG